MDRDQIVIFAIVFGSIIFAVILMQFYFDVRRAQNKQEKEKQEQQRANQIFVRKMRVLERIENRTQGYISGSMYLLESEGGERVTLRLRLSSKLNLAVGDTGIVQYKGDYIESFERIEPQEEKQK